MGFGKAETDFVDIIWAREVGSMQFVCEGLRDGHSE